MLIFIVDDDPHFRLFATKALEQRGYEVQAFDTAFGLVNRAAGFEVDGQLRATPSLIVLDHMLPGLEGGDSLRLLAHDTRTADIPVVLVSAGPAPVLQAIAEEHPRCRFVAKTGRMAPVVAAIQEAIDDATQPADAARYAGSRG